MKKAIMICITAAVMMAPVAAHAARVIVAPAYGWGYSSYWGPYPYPYGYYDNVPATGAVKFDTSVKDAEVYINGAYAGTVGKLKTMHLRTGSYDIELRAPGRTQFDKKVYVSPGKTLHLNPELRVQAQSPAQP
jgi:PEGA domain-containing protein